MIDWFCEQNHIPIPPYVHFVHSKDQAVELFKQVRISKLDALKVYGWCLDLRSLNQDIHIAYHLFNNMNDETIFHELVHYRQFYTYTAEQIFPSILRWKDGFYPINEEGPWEQEAYYEQELWNQRWQNTQKNKLFTSPMNIKNFLLGKQSIDWHKNLKLVQDL